MQRSAILNVVGLTAGLIGEHTPRIRAFAQKHQLHSVRPVLPAVTCTAQSTYLTGTAPSGHGCVANGWYHRELAEHQFWKQSNRLVAGEKLWETLKARDPEFTCAKLFWWYNMYSTADYSITPRPMYPADGRKVFDVYTHPMEMREAIKEDLGEFPFPSFWGPMAGLPCSQWIADSARWVERKHEPALSLVYLPHLDYNFQRLGPDDPAIAGDLAEIDTLVGNLIDFYEERGVSVALLSEYGITAVDRPVHLNRIFRREGWITIKDELGLEMLDCGASRVFAIADHQVAHVYLNDPEIKHEVVRLLEKTEGVEKVLYGASLAQAGLDHERSGDIVVMSDARSWFTYYYWLDDALAPDFARCVDIHRKPGYDPVELFLDPKLKLAKLKVAWSLVKKKLGFRMLMNVIPLDASLVKGSHGRVPEREADWPVLIGEFGDFGKPSESSPLEATDVHGLLLDFAQGS